ncbi:hypothetical protein [Ruficoccus sp. ZRK36]|uniref:hypothetical protein n=1 Tax=Ruficoccus sp. ZRK36 TaxID=2866311 RepID=UPI001C73B5DE|nr:hypothetical protein [Ruficoccus sp. ZRK36]QYY34339.1 hypothetical protein K0V07_08405 [Ruficoccus sp. ZRK36]
MFKKLILPTALMLSIGAFTQANATVMFEESFDEYTAGQTIPHGTPTDNWNGVSSVITFDAENDSSQIFPGTDNKYALLSGSNIASQAVISTNTFANTSTTGQMSFDFYTPESSSWSSSDYLILRVGTSSSNSSTAFALLINKGVIYSSAETYVGKGDELATYSTDTVNSLTIVFNNSSSELDYSGQTIAAGTIDVYLNNQLIGQDIPNNSGGLAQDTPIGMFNFNPKAGFSGEIYLDNIEVNSAISIPESSTAGWLALVILPITIATLRKRYSKSQA